ncbi:hypothetical protein SDC9_103398 [bioreactor metagenome]|uniref:Uncharacterized protein n=1 Tax=bioreactor metagenome TaxID=1076179 RepID=A0A645AU28_9ZZZZ
MSDFSMDIIGEIQRTGTRWQFDDIAFRSEDINLVLEDILLDAFDELTSVLGIILQVDQITEPIDLMGHLIGIDFFGDTLFVCPVSRNPVLRDLVHFDCPDLDFDWRSLCPDNCRMQRLIHIRLRHGDIVFEPTRHRFPFCMNSTQNGITVFDGMDDDADSQKIIDFRELFLLVLHFPINGVDMLRPAVDVGLNL